MMRFILSASIAAMGLAFLATSEAEAWAEGRSGGGSGYSGHMGSRGGDYRHGSSHFDYRFPYRPSHGFGYERYGYRSLYYSHYHWSSDYRCYVYWAPYYRCWCFYEPTYSYYVPVSYYRQVYPEASVVTAPPSVVQQTTVVAGTTPPLAPVADAGPAAPIPPVAAAPVAVQKTKVGTP
jgi:hypothetical protein